jgi:GT2 family glycosyltransferase
VAARVAVAVVSWNTRDLLRGCLASLAADAASGFAEVCVVDAGSADGSAAMARAEFAWARVVERPENPGYGAAVNAGLAALGGAAEWVACANADVALEPGALRALVAAGARDAGAGAVAPRLVAPDGSTQHSVHPFPGVRFALAHNAGLGRVSARWARARCLHGAWDPGVARRVPWAVGAFLLVRRAAWEAVGGFDPARWMYAEDLDLGWRLARAGWATRYEPSARVRHDEAAATAQAWGDARLARATAAQYAWLRERRGAAVARGVAAAYVAGEAARWALEPRRRPAHAAWARLHAAGLRA